MISISFSGIKMLWLLGGLPPRPSLISLIFLSFMPHFFSPQPPKNEDIKRYAYAKMPSVRFFCGNAHRHLIMRKYTNAYKHMGSILTSYWWFVEQNEMPEWNQLWN